jgi:hypothetical protein
MTAATDYARAVEQLSKAHLAPYVSFVQRVRVNGMAKTDSTDRVVVRVRDGKVIEGSTVSYNSQSGSQQTNPITSPIFDPSCYRATNESPSTIDGALALKLDLVPVCSETFPGDRNYAFNTLYVDPATLRPIEASGSVPPDADSKGVAVSLDQRYGTFDGHVMPTETRVDVTGSGWMFWLQVHFHEEFSDYRFLNSP